jgi:hypothetical protein
VVRRFDAQQRPGIGCGQQGGAGGRVAGDDAVIELDGVEQPGAVNWVAAGDTPAPRWGGVGARSRAFRLWW